MKKLIVSIVICIFLIIPLTFAQTNQNPDIDGSGEVDILDVLQVVNDFGKTAGFNPRVDLNNDGVINVLDILIIVSNWGAVPADPPTINSFTASPQTINPGESSTLSWSVTGSGSFTLNPGNIDVIGTAQMAVTPLFTTTYNLTAVNSAGMDSKFLTVVKRGPNPHLKYFSYYGSEFIAGCDGTICALEIADHSNVIHVYAHLGNFQYLRDTFKLAAENGLLVMVNFAGMIWNDHGFTLDFQQDWDQLAAFLKPYESQIAAFEHLSEPYSYIRNEYDGRVLPDEQEVIDHAKTVNNAIKADFPDIPIAIVYSQWIKLDEGGFCPSCDFQVPPEFDWIGVECYIYTTDVSIEDCDGYGHGIQYYYDLLKAKKASDQKLYLVSDGQYFRDYLVVDGDKVEIPLTPELEQRKVDIANWHYNLAKSEPDVIMIQPYLWASYQARFLYRGTRDMPAVRATYNQIGREITGK
jgi:hypothetical protein